jgi:K+-transporting ATPase KdpF subunit
VRFCLSAGLLRKPATSSRRKAMDFIIAGLTALGLFIYLVYALLLPERF